MAFDKSIDPPSASRAGRWGRDSGLLHSASGFIQDFAGYAGVAGLRALALTALGAVLDSVSLLLLVPITGIVIGAPGGTSAHITEELLQRMGLDGRVARLTILLAGFGVLVALRTLGQWRRDIALAQLRVGFVAARRGALVARIVAAPWEQLSRMDHARLNALAGSDIPMMSGSVFFILQGSVAFGVLLCLWLLAFILSPVLATTAAVLMLLAFVLFLPWLATSRMLGRETVAANLELAARGTQFFAGLKLAISQNAQARFAREFSHALGMLLGRQVQLLREQSRAQMLFTAMSAIAAALTLLLGIGPAAVAPQVLIVFILLLARMAGPAGQLQLGLQQLATFLPAYEKVRGLEHELRTAQPAVADQTLPATPVPIRFRGVSFSYPGGAIGVRDLDLDLAPASFVGVTGASGSGKSSFADLLVGLTLAQTGSILLGSESLTDQLRPAWRARAGYVPQETFLFHDTVRRNLTWIVEDADDAALWQVLEVTGADTLVRRLDGGLDAMVGEHGQFLSGGERQRLAIARALLRKPPLLVLDEATSALDLEAEAALLQRLRTLSWQPTIVLIAHRPQSLAHCERVLVLSNGRLVEARPVKDLHAAQHV